MSPAPSRCNNAFVTEPFRHCPSLLGTAGQMPKTPDLLRHCPVLLGTAGQFAVERLAGPPEDMPSVGHDGRCGRRIKYVGFGAWHQEFIAISGGPGSLSRPTVQVRASALGFAMYGCVAPILAPGLISMGTQYSPVSTYTASPAACPLAVANSISCGARASPTGMTRIPAACNGAANASSGARGVA